LLPQGSRYALATLIRAVVFLVYFALASSFEAHATSIGECDYQPPEPQSEEEREALERSEAQWARLGEYLALLPSEPDEALLMPVAGVRVAQVANTWGAPRGAGRLHEGQDIFAPRGTPIYSATEGIVWRIGVSQLGGLVVWVVGAGGRRYYYAHLERYGDHIQEGDFVTPDTVIGYVGNTGNAATTPPHLHFGIYYGSRRTCDRQVFDPLPLLRDR
jgi:murein DD-endopeptidase MepM/ murein hydrolase activator NlpD